ncbi:MAG: helix-turn-helix transcriptional regulator [Candidatus Cryptobacteroides sp.]
MVTELIEKYIWLMQVLLAASDKGLSLNEISNKYERRFGTELTRRTFINHRNAVQDIFGVDIICDRRTNIYSVGARSRMEGTAERLVDSFTVNMVLEQGRERLGGRIFVETIPSGHKHLTSIISAMLENRCLEIAYCKYSSAEPELLTVHPYALKEDKRRWYLYAHCEERNALRCYSLDRIGRLEMLDGRFVFPDSFDLDALLATSFGTFIPQEGEKGCTITFRAKGVQGRYIEDLPIHHSQQILRKEGDWTYFTIFVSPESSDLYFELRKYGALIEVTGPQKVRDRLRAEAEAVAALYGTCPGKDGEAPAPDTSGK